MRIAGVAFGAGPDQARQYPPAISHPAPGEPGLEDHDPTCPDRSTRGCGSGPGTSPSAPPRSNVTRPADQGSVRPRVGRSPAAVGGSTVIALQRSAGQPRGQRIDGRACLHLARDVIRGGCGRPDGGRGRRCGTPGFHRRRRLPSRGSRGIGAAAAPTQTRARTPPRCAVVRGPAFRMGLLRRPHPPGPGQRSPRGGGRCTCPDRGRGHRRRLPQRGHRSGYEPDLLHHELTHVVQQSPDRRRATPGGLAERLSIGAPAPHPAPTVTAVNAGAELGAGRTLNVTATAAGKGALTWTLVGAPAGSPSPRAAPGAPPSAPQLPPWAPLRSEAAPTSRPRPPSPRRRPTLRCPATSSSSRSTRSS